MVGLGLDDLVLGRARVFPLHVCQLGAQGTCESQVVFGEVWGGLSQEQESCYSICILRGLEFGGALFYPHFS